MYIISLFSYSLFNIRHPFRLQGRIFKAVCYAAAYEIIVSAEKFQIPKAQ